MVVGATAGDFDPAVQTDTFAAQSASMDEAYRRGELSEEDYDAAIDAIEQDEEERLAAQMGQYSFGKNNKSAAENGVHQRGIANLTEQEQQDGLALTRFINEVVSMIDFSKRSKRKMKIGVVSQNHANHINRLMQTINPEFSAEGYEMWIDGTGAGHIESRHGAQGKADHSMATVEAKMLIPWVVQNANASSFIIDDSGRIKLSNRFYNSDGSRPPEIRLEKSLNGDTVYVSECVPDSTNKRIWITSAYIKKGSNGQMLNMEGETSLQPTPEATFDGNATTDIVPKPSPYVKNNKKTVATVDSSSTANELRKDDSATDAIRHSFSDTRTEQRKAGAGGSGQAAAEGAAICEAGQEQSAQEPCQSVGRFQIRGPEPSAGSCGRDRPGISADRHRGGGKAGRAV